MSAVEASAECAAVLTIPRSCEEGRRSAPVGSVGHSTAGGKDGGIAASRGKGDDGREGRGGG